MLRRKAVAVNRCEPQVGACRSAAGGCRRCSFRGQVDRDCQAAAFAGLCPDAAAVDRGDGRDDRKTEAKGADQSRFRAMVYATAKATMITVQTVGCTRTSRSAIRRGGRTLGPPSASTIQSAPRIVITISPMKITGL